MFHRGFLILASVASVLCVQSADVRASADFYAGKTVRIVIGASMGGEYGLYSQLVARHIGRFVPGKPTVIVQSMPGGGGMNALNYVANVAPQDGTVLSLPHVNIVQEGLLNPKVRFDPRKFQWIGRLREQLQVGVASAKSNVKSLADAKSQVLIAGATAANNPTALNPRILNTLAGTKFKVVTGYRGTGEVAIAWERGEVDVLTTGWDNVVRRYSELLRSKKIHPVYVYGMQRPKELSDVPLVSEFARTKDEQAFLQIYSIGPEIGRSLAAPPGVPRDRVEMWRTAFTMMLNDPEFKQAVADGNIWINPLNGDELASRVKRAIAIPAEAIERSRKFYEQLLAPVR